MSKNSKGSKSSVPELAKQLSNEAEEKTASAEKPVIKNDREKLIEQETGNDITSLERPNDSQSAIASTIGSDIAKGIIEGMNNAGINNQQQGMQPRQYGTVTGRVQKIEKGDVVGYFPLRGGKGKSCGGWFKVAENAEVSPKMNRKAVSLVSYYYDEGQGILYHQMEFRTLQFWTEKHGPVERSSLEAARKYQKHIDKPKSNQPLYT